jgi:hypothetical protein
MSLARPTVRLPARLGLVGGCVIALAAAVATPSAARADCCLSGPSAPADFHARSVSGGPVRLLPITTVEVSSQAAADYTALITVSVGSRVIARTTEHGQSDTSWSVLRIPLSGSQRHAITTTANHEGRRAVLGVGLSGILAGARRTTGHLIYLTMSVPGERPAGDTAGSGPEQTTRISLARQLVDGAGESLRGRLVIHTPTATFERTNQDASPSARFSVDVTATCHATVNVSPRAVATRESAVTQARDSVSGDQLLRASEGTGRVWRLAELDGVDEATGEPNGTDLLYGIAVLPLGPRRWIQAREIAEFTGSCTGPDLADSAFTTALAGILGSVTGSATIGPVVH